MSQSVSTYTLDLSSYNDFCFQIPKNGKSLGNMDRLSLHKYVKKFMTISDTTEKKLWRGKIVFLSQNKPYSQAGRICSYIKNFFSFCVCKTSAEIALAHQESLEKRISVGEFKKLKNQGVFDFSFLDLEGIDLQGMDLKGCDFTAANLKGGNFSEADLREAIFNFACLEDADFTNADLRGGHLQDVKLKGGIFVDAFLDDGCFEGINLRGVVLTEADFFDPIYLNGKA